MTTTADAELTETLVENFVATMKFVANNDLWDEAQAALAKQGITTIQLSSAPIRAFRALLSDELLPADRLEAPQRKHARAIEECGCGMVGVGPGGHVKSGADAHGTDAGVPETLPDGG